jgi:hypothetical protein
VIPGIRSRYFKKEPEIIADIPWRVEPGKSVPLLILIKDAHLYYIFLKKATVQIFSRSGEKIKSLEVSINRKVFHKFWWVIEEIDVSDIKRPAGLEFSVTIDYVNSKGKEKSCRLDNYSFRTPALKTFLAENRLLPENGRLKDWYSADFHLHSSYTEDQIEFAAPLKATSIMAKTIGLNIIGVTDHAYDLNDSFSSYLSDDKNHPKWKDFLSNAASLNREKSSPPFLVIPGQETTVNKKKGKNIHLQIFNSQELIPGEADSGVKWLNKYSSRINYSEVLNGLSGESLACAAHIGEIPPLLHRILLGRSGYSQAELEHPGLSAVQIFNGIPGDGRMRGLDLWKKALLKGKKLTPLAGSDSHGNFSLARYILLPHFRLRMAEKQLLGEIRTVIWLNEEELKVENVIEAVKCGKVQLSTGPVFEVKSGNGESPLFGETLTASELRGKIFTLRAFSTEEFGLLNKLIIYAGRKNDAEEIKIKDEPLPSEYQVIKEISFENIDLTGFIYIRFEIYVSEKIFSFSAPVYLNK